MPKTLLRKKHTDFFKKNRFKISGSDMSRKFGLARNAAAQWLRNNGLSVPKKLQNKFRGLAHIGTTTSTPAIDKFIRKNYLKIPVKTMADIINEKMRLNKSDTFFQGRIKQLGLVIPKAIIEQRKKDSQIKPGNIPMNKGLKQKEYMSKAAIKKTMATRFKKGGLPPTTLYDGCITTRSRTDRGKASHKYIRLAKAKWQELQIYNWEKKYGPVPKGFVLACKDGNTLNCKPSNWYPMSMVDNMKRNSASLRLTDGYVAFCICGKNRMHLFEEIYNNKPLLEAKRSQLLLNRKIKTIENGRQERIPRAA